MKNVVKRVLTCLMVLGLAFTKFVLPVSAEEETTAYLTFASEDWGVQYWIDENDYAPVVSNEVAVDGFGQYTVSLDFTGTEAGFATGIAFLDVEVSNGETAYPNSYMTIDSIVINGEEATYGKTYTSSDDGVATRTNLYNEWVETIEEGRTADGDATDVTALPLDKTPYTEVKTVEVTFTLGEGVVTWEKEAAEEEEYVMPESFNAFMMFSDTSGAWETYEAGVSGDTEVIGDGKYTVYLTAEDVGATGQAEEGQVFLVDIEGLGEAMVHLGTLTEDPETEALTVTDATATVKIWVDGTELSVKNDNILMGDIEGNGRFRLELYNAWGTGTVENPVVMPSFLNPASEIKVEFELLGTGLNSDYTPAVEEADTTEVEVSADTTDEAVVATDEEAGLPMAAIIAIIVGAVVIVCGVVVVLVKKKK